jgi:hypothetical protein
MYDLGIATNKPGHTMSAYLMDQQDTAILAVYAETVGLAKSAAAAATLLRSANNAALKSQYGDKLVRLSKGIIDDIAEARNMLTEGITVAGIHDEKLTTGHVLILARQFKYQCEEGDCDPRPGYKLIVAIVNNLENK